MIRKKHIPIGPLAHWFTLTLTALTLFSAPLIVTGDPLPADTFYVAPGGDDNNPGTLEFPLQSLEAARQKVRDHKATFGLGIGGIAVILREGTWTRTQSLVLSSQDGGEPGRPVVWRAFPGETVRVLGAATVQADWFELVTDAHPEWDRVPVEARGNVYVVNLSDHGITDYGTLRARGFLNKQIGALELFSDKAPMQLARWPDPDQFELIDTVLTTTSFTVTTDRMDRWTSAPEPWFHGHWKYMWADEHIDFASIDTGTNTVTLSKAPKYGMDAASPFYAYNLLEELTLAGEWYLERSTDLLYWWPNGTIGDLEIMVSMLEEPLMTVTDAEYLQFEGISFGMGREHLVTVDGGNNVVFNGCVFFGSGNDGLHLRGESQSLLRSEIVDIGESGVILDGGDRASLTPGNNLVENTEIHRMGRWVWQSSIGIRLQGVGNTASHNHVHDAPQIAIQFVGNDHLIEYNEINDVCKFSNDAGAIYGGSGSQPPLENADPSWGGRGTQIEYNYIHDIVGDSAFDGPNGVHGVYFDNISSGNSVFGNYFIDIANSGANKAIMHGGGRDVLIENNIMVRTDIVFFADSRGFAHITDPARPGLDLLDKLHRNGVMYQQEPWCSTYPELCAMPNDWTIIAADSSLWKYPEGSVFSRNLGWQNHWFTIANNYGGTGTFDKFAEIKDNLENTDPRFVNEAAGDYRLAADSPALSIPGFVDIPFQQMGIVEPPPGAPDDLLFGEGFEPN